MKVSYDSQVDAAFIKLSDNNAYGAVEIDEGVVIHVTKENKIVAIEILNASKKISVKELFKYEIEQIQAD